MNGTGASKKASMEDGRMGSSRDCHAKGRSKGIRASVVTERTPRFGQKTTICRSNSAPAHHTVS